MSSGDVLMLSVSGLRGHMGSSLTPEVASRFAVGFAAWLRAQERASGPVRLALGRDGRRGSDLFASVVRSALLAAGHHLIDLDIAMTPTVAVVVDGQGLDGGLVVTASHNPQPWCGLKPIVRSPGAKAGKADASAPSKTTAEAIIERFRTAVVPVPGTWETLGHSTTEPELGRAHLGRVRAALGASAKKLERSTASVVVDNLGMSGAAMSDSALRSLAPRASVEQLYEASGDLDNPELRGTFPHTPEPTAENLTGLARRVKRAKADAGFAQDPDADRLAVVDERGRYIGEEYTLVLAAMALGELGRLGKGDRIAVNLSTSRMIDDVAASLGAKVVRTPVGEANVVEAMKRERCVLGGEGNGGVIWPEVTYIRDSLGAMALIMALRATKRKSISDLIANVPAYAIVKRKVELSRPGQAVEAADRVRAGFGGHRVDVQDGVRVDFVDQRAWLHVRGSNTEPIMRLIAEAPTRPIAESILDKAARLIG